MQFRPRFVCFVQLQKMMRNRLKNLTASAAVHGVCPTIVHQMSHRTTMRCAMTTAMTIWKRNRLGLLQLDQLQELCLNSTEEMQGNARQLKITVQSAENLDREMKSGLDAPSVPTGCINFAAVQTMH